MYKAKMMQEQHVKETGTSSPFQAMESQALCSLKILFLGVPGVRCKSAWQTPNCDTIALPSFLDSQGRAPRKR